MVHEPHNEEGNDPRQILKDGCGECEARGRDLRIALGHMDPSTFRRAWNRAWDFEHDKDIGRVSRAERPLLDALYCVRNQLQNGGFFGLLPPMRWIVTHYAAKPEGYAHSRGGMTEFGIAVQRERVFAETTEEAVAVARAWARETGDDVGLTDCSTGLYSIVHPDGSTSESEQPNKTAGT